MSVSTINWRLASAVSMLLVSLSVAHSAPPFPAPRVVDTKVVRVLTPQMIEEARRRVILVGEQPLLYVDVPTIENGKVVHYWGYEATVKAYMPVVGSWEYEIIEQLALLPYAYSLKDKTYALATGDATLELFADAEAKTPLGTAKIKPVQGEYLITDVAWKSVDFKKQYAGKATATIYARLSSSKWSIKPSNMVKIDITGSSDYKQ